MDTPPPSPASGEFEELLFACLERHAESGSAGVEALLVTHPQAAARVRQELARLARLGMLGPEPQDSLPQTLGGFRLIRKLGEGGMGLVWEAEDPALGRRLALKMIRPDQLHFSGARERFRREVEAVARLQHPGIVPIYSVGEDRGVPYFTMELLDGCSLSEALRELSGCKPSGLHGRDLARAVEAKLAQQDRAARAEGPLFEADWPDACVMIARQAAEALEHAHSRGLIHRDLKPSNLALTRTGRVLLFDFGLARAEAVDGLTRSGVQPGSLPYMSPEQVRGDADLDARSDIYSLGATLYELLTLQPAFPPGSWEQTRERILAGSVTPLAAHNPGLSWDFETVCVVAMERDRARRYATAQDLARDLGALLHHQQIEARRPGFWLRTRRWTQRHPAQAVGATLGALLLLAGPVGWELSRARSLEEITAAYEKSEQDFRVALSAIGHVLRDTATEELEDVPRMQQARLVALDRALQLYGELSASRPDDPLVLSEGAELHTSRASVLEDLGRRQEQAAELEVARELLDRLQSLAPSVENVSRSAVALARLGKCHTGMGDTDRALEFLREAIRRLETVPDASASPDVLLATAEALSIAGEPAEAERMLKDCENRLLSLQAAKPASSHSHWSLGRVRSWQRAIAFDSGDFRAARTLAMDTLKCMEAAEQLSPGSRFYNFDVADAWRDLAAVELELGLTAESEASQARARERIESLLRDFPDSTRYRNLKADLLVLQSTQAGRRGDFAAAMQVQELLVEEARAAASIQPERCDLALRAAEAHCNLAATLHGLQRKLEEVLAQYDSALAALKPCSFHPADLESAGKLTSFCHYGSALALLHHGQVEPALARIDQHGQSIGKDPTRMRYAADLQNELILALRRSTTTGAGNAASAREKAAEDSMFDWLERAVEAGYRDNTELNSTPALESFRADPRFQALLRRIEEG